MQRREFLKAAALSAAAMALPRELFAADSPVAPAGAARKPNIIFVLADDLGIGNVGCYGSDNFKTPQLDALAKSGIRFQHCYSTPLCGPSRAQILTGRYPFRTGMTGNTTGRTLLPANETMMPKVLKSAGYVTAQVGKWNQLPLEPGDWGFDEYLRFPGSGRYWRDQTVNYTLNGKQVDLPQGKHLPDIMHDFLVDFMTRHGEQPFYVHYAISHIHGPIVRTPDSAPDSKDFYTDNVAYMDKLIGRLVADLERLKLRDKTLIVFVGDNGTAAGWADRATVNGGKRLSGQKGTMLEGGSLVPMVVSWPGTTPSGRAVDELVDFSDFFPTFAELAGAKPPVGVTIDGHSMAAQIKGQTGTPREWAYVELNGKWYARSARWKLNNDGELFDMKNAPFEEKLVPAGSTDPEAVAARKSLQAVLDKLNPAAGKQPKPGAPVGKKQARKARKKARRPNAPAPSQPAQPPT